MNSKSCAKYLPGTTFKTRGKNPQVCTVTDVLVTTNLCGNIVKTRYVATHEFMGQIVTDRDVVETAISMGLVNAIPMPMAVNS